MLSFTSPHGVAVDDDGTIVVADFGNRVVRAIDASGNVSTLAGTVRSMQGPFSDREAMTGG